MKKQIRRRKAIALVLCLFMMLSITPLSYADEMVADAPAADITDSGYESVDVTDVDNSVDSIVSDIFENETPAGDVEGIVEDGTEADATVETPADSEGPAPQEPQYDENGNLIVPEEGAEESVEEVTEGDVPGAICTNPDCQCPCHMELTDEMLAEGMGAMECVDPDCACPCHPQQEVKECTCGAEEGQPHDPSCPLYVEVSEEILALYEQLMACETQEEIDAFVAELTEEQLNALCEYMLKLQEPVVIETVNFTEAGPFMPPVTVETSLPKRMMKAARGIMAAPMALFLSDEPAPLADRRDVDGLVTSKVVTQNDDGSFKITLEAYTTGKVTTETSTIPVDIVLVLDQSGSMAYGFDGNSTNINSNRRQYAMRTAVRAFIDSVGGKYDVAKADHRIAIVTFGSNASTEQGWTAVDSTGVTSLKRTIGDPTRNEGLGITPSGATNVAAGMTQAQTLLNESYTGQNPTRQQVVIVFTDGVPTTNRDFEMKVANNALVEADAIKEKGATIYSVGIFNGAQPNQTYGEKWDYVLNTDIPCSGEVGSYWGGSWVSNIFVGTNDFEAGDIVPANRFLNFLSSKATGATEMGITPGNFNPGNHFLAGGNGWRIDKNPTSYDSSKGYYLTADNADALNNIFQTISEQISTSDYPLNESAVVKDFVTPYFNMPANASGIRVKTADCTGKSGGEYTFAPAVDSTLSVTISGDTVSVTGFDFNANDVSEDIKTTTGDRGRKLIIEFDVTPKDGFLGGNNVPTNGAESGVYAPIVGSTETMGVVEEFEVPHVNVPIKDVAVTAEEKNVYLLGTLTQDKLMEGVTVKLGDAPAQGETTDNRIELNLSAPNYGLYEWQNAFVNINIAKPDNITAGITGDRDYTVSATVKPTAAAVSTSVGTANDMAGKSGNATATINVFKPEVTYADTNVWYGADAPDYTALDGCRTSVEWKHGETVAVPANMIGDAPTLSYSYALPNAAVADGKIATKKDIPVQATVKIGTTNVNDYITFVHTNCTGKTDEMSGIDAQFLLHNHTCSLTLRKTGGNTGESYIFNINKDGNPYMTVSVPANESITISELPVGNYSAVEDANWSWRFTQASGSATLSASQSGSNGTISCTNTANNNVKWLNGYAEVVTNTSTATTTASAGVLPMGENPIQYNNTPAAANLLSNVADAILNTNVEVGELNA